METIKLKTPKPLAMPMWLLEAYLFQIANHTRAGCKSSPRNAGVYRSLQTTTQKRESAIF